MEAEVIVPFWDMETGLGCCEENTYHVGDTFIGTAERVNGLVAKGLVKKKPQQRKKRAAKPKEK